MMYLEAKGDGIEDEYCDNNQYNHKNDAYSDEDQITSKLSLMSHAFLAGPIP